MAELVPSSWQIQRPTCTVTLEKAPLHLLALFPLSVMVWGHLQGGANRSRGRERILHTVGSRLLWAAVRVYESRAKLSGRSVVCSAPEGAAWRGINPAKFPLRPVAPLG